MPNVAIIVLNYNGRDCLSSCLASLRSITYPEKRIYIVDNGSSDGSFEIAKRDFPENSFIENGKNLGFAAGMNRGIRIALEDGADFVWLFNYDAAADPAALDMLIETAAKHPEAGIWSPLITDETGTPWFSKGRIDHLRMRALHITATEKELASESYPSPFVTGCAMLIRKEVFDRIGFLDERFFLYYEDADFCLRAGKAGYGCRVVPSARVSHAEKSQENPEKTYHLVYSGLLFSKRHAPAALRPYLLAYATIRRLKNSLDRLRGRDGAETIRRAWSDFDRYGNLPNFLDRHRQL